MIIMLFIGIAMTVNYIFYPSEHLSVFSEDIATCAKSLALLYIHEK